MCCNKLKNIIIFFMISCLLTSCSNHDKNNDKEKNMDYYDIKELSINYDNIHFLKCSLLGKDQVIFLSGDSIYSEATEQSLYSFCLNSGEMKNIKPEIEFRSNSYYTVAGTEDGRIFLITSSADKNNKEMEDDSSYDNEEFSYKLFEIDEYGSLISEKNIDIEINNDFISNFIVWNDYFVLFNNENQKSFLTVIDSNGDVIDSLIDEISGDIISVCISYNNQLSVMSVDGSDVVISLFDFNDLKKVNKFEYKNNDMINYTSIFGGNESNNLIINSELKLIGLNTDGEKSNIIEWNDSILSDVRTEMIISGENNDFTIFGTYCGESKIYKLTKLPCVL